MKQQEGEEEADCLHSNSCELTLDTNTMNRCLRLSDNNRKVTEVTEEQPYPDHPERFECREQLLCRTGVTGRCYWEAEWEGIAYLSVTYKGIRRKGENSDYWFGGNDHSWSLRCCFLDNFSVSHDTRSTDLPRASLSSSSISGRVAVYVDCPAGILSFYKASSDSLIHLHTFNTTFTEPLYPGIGFGYGWPGSSVTLCPLWDGARKSN